MNKITFTVYGEPVAQARPRFKHVKTNDGREFDMAYEKRDGKSKAFKDRLYDQAKDYRPDKPIESAIILTAKVFMPIPKSMPKYKQQLALAGEIRPITRPDLDNIIKAIKDGMRKVFWRDDSQVVGYGDTGKWYSDVPRVEITIMAL